VRLPFNRQARAVRLPLNRQAGAERLPFNRQARALRASIIAPGARRASRS